MRKRIIGGIVFLCVGALLSVGCAKKEIVKTEQPVAPSVQTTQPAPPPPAAKPAEAKPEAKPEALPETPTKEATVSPEAAKEAQPAAMEESALQNALQKIYFNFDSSDLSEDSRSALSKNGDLLMKNPSAKVRIEGNCDERGSDEYNMALGERRAKAARDYLVNLGVQPDRLTIISYGEEKPADPGHDEAAWAKNRRDEFVIVK